MFIQKVILNLNKLPQPVKISSIVYIGCLICYNTYGTYDDSTIYLNKYREGKLTDLIEYDSEINSIKTDLDAAKYGANINFLERLWYSIVWPIILIQNTVPAIVLGLNPKKN